MLSYDPHSRGQGHVGSAGRAGTEELVPAGLLGDRGWCSEPSEGSTTRHPNSLQPFTPRIQLHTARPRALSNLQYPPTAASDREETPGKQNPDMRGGHLTRSTPGSAAQSALRRRTPSFPTPPDSGPLVSRHAPHCRSKVAGRAIVTLAEALCGPREVRDSAATAPDGGTAGPGVAADESGNHAPARSVARSELR